MSKYMIKFAIGAFAAFVFITAFAAGFESASADEGLCLGCSCNYWCAYSNPPGWRVGRRVGGCDMPCEAYTPCAVCQVT
jgi:hypothetical protein